MKVLQVNNIFPSRSTGKIVAAIHTELKRRGHASVVCHGMRDFVVSDPDAHLITEEPLTRLSNYWIYFSGLMYGGCFLATTRLLRRIRQEKPDIVHLHCVNGRTFNLYRLVSWLKHHKIKTVVTLHAEFVHTGNCGHAMDCEKWRTGCGNCPHWSEVSGPLHRDGSGDSWRKMKRAFHRFEQNCRITSVSPWLMERAKQSPILRNCIHSAVLNGLDDSVFYPRDPRPLRKQLGLTHEKVIFHATANFSNREDDLKGGRYLLQLAEQLKDEPVKIFVAGRYESTSALPENVVLLGNLDNQDLLAQYYSLADVTVITSRKETFSMVVAESLCCGTPVVGFEAGGPESIALPDYSAFAKQGDLGHLKILVQQMLDRNHDPHIIAETAQRRYSAEAMCEAYMEVYRDLLPKDGIVAE